MNIHINPILGNINFEPIGEKQTIITRITPIGTKTKVIDINHQLFEEKLNNWINGEKIQSAFRMLCSQDREFILNGSFLE
jgi:hypothetical protein